jgi:hypothetical protein
MFLLLWLLVAPCLAKSGGHGNRANSASLKGPFPRSVWVQVGIFILGSDWVSSAEGLTGGVFEMMYPGALRRIVLAGAFALLALAPGVLVSGEAKAGGPAVEQDYFDIDQFYDELAPERQGRERQG